MKETKRRLLRASTAGAGLTDPNPDAERRLFAAGWKRWDGFPDDGLLEKINKTHLRVEVWEREDPPAIAVAFGGTIFNNEDDWRANLRWFSLAKRDEYTDVVQRFAPAFDQELIAGNAHRPNLRAGGVLAIFRSLLSLIYRPSQRSPTIRGVRYKLFRAWNAIAAHSMMELALKLDAAVTGFSNTRKAA